jgi:hypothetical protein
MSDDFDNCMSSQQGQVGKVIDTRSSSTESKMLLRAWRSMTRCRPLERRTKNFVAALVTYRDTKRGAVRNGVTSESNRSQHSSFDQESNNYSDVIPTFAFTPGINYENKR